MRLSWRRWSSATRTRGWGLIVFYIVIAVALLFGGYWIAKLLASTAPTPSVPVLGLIGALYVLLFTFMLSQALMLITESIYQRGDLDFLLASPLPPWRILLVRMAAIAINVALLYLMLLGAVFIFLPFFGGWQWMAFLPSVLGLALLATGVGLVLARGMFLVFGPKLTRIIAQIAAGLIGASFFLAMQSQNFVPYEQRAQVFSMVMQRLAPILGDPLSPLSLPARASLGAPGAFAAWIAVAFGGYALAVWWFASRFVANAAAIAGAGNRRRADTSERQMRGGLGPSLVRKEWRLLLRDPLLLSQIMLQLLYLLPLFFIFTRQLGHEGLQRYSIGGFASAFVLLATSLAASLAWLTVSAEDAPDLIAAAPVPREEIEHAKAFAAGTPVVALLLLPAIGAGWLAPMAGVWLFIGGVLAIGSACLVAVWHQAPGDRKNFRRRRRGTFLVSFGQFFVTIGWTAATALAVVGWPLLSLLPALIALGALLALHESRPRA
jgi:ABC-2 type transport system permease protein